MYSFTSRVRYSECDEHGRLTLISMLNYLQDTSTFQSASLGQPVLEPLDGHLAWILGGWEIEVDELPSFNEEVTVSTWSYAMTRTQALRCFEVRDKDGRSLVRADSQWFVFDAERGRAVRVPQDQEVYVEDTPRLEMPPMAKKLVVEGEAQDAAPVAIAQHNLDTNHHVNNAQYVQLALDALAGLGHSADVGRLAVRYRNMARLGDTVCPRVFGGEKDGWTVSLEAPDGTVFATVRLA